MSAPPSIRRLLPVALLVLLACGSGEPAGPGGDRDPELVGRWARVSTTIFDILEGRVRLFLENLDVPAEEIDESVALVLAEIRADDRFYDSDEILTFAADGTWSSSTGTSGRWSADGATLSMEGSLPGATTDFDYLLAGDELTLTMSFVEARELLDASPAIDSNELGLFNAVFQETDLFEYRLVRVD